MGVRESDEIDHSQVGAPSATQGTAAEENIAPVAVDICRPVVYLVLRKPAGYSFRLHILASDDAGKLLLRVEHWDVAHTNLVESIISCLLLWYKIKSNTFMTNQSIAIHLRKF